MKEAKKLFPDTQLSSREVISVALRAYGRFIKQGDRMKVQGRHQLVCRLHTVGTGTKKKKYFVLYDPEGKYCAKYREGDNRFNTLDEDFINTAPPGQELLQAAQTEFDNWLRNQHTYSDIEEIKAEVEDMRMQLNDITKKIESIYCTICIKKRKAITKFQEEQQEEDNGEDNDGGDLVEELDEKPRIRKAKRKANSRLQGTKPTIK